MSTVYIENKLDKILAILIQINERNPVITVNPDVVIINNDNHTFFYDSNGEMITETPETVYLFKTSITRLDYIDNSIDTNFNYQHGVQIYSIDGSSIQRFFETKELAMKYLSSFL